MATKRINPDPKGALDVDWPYAHYGTREWKRQINWMYGGEYKTNGWFLAFKKRGMLKNRRDAFFEGIARFILNLKRKLKLTSY